MDLAIRRLKEEADFQADLVTGHLRHEETVPVDEASLMQMDGGRLSASARLAMTRRPREWIRALAERLDERVRVLLRSWLTTRLNRVAGTTVTVGMMIRDVLHECVDHPVEAAAEREAQRLAQEIQRDVEGYLDRAHRHDLLTSQQWLLHQSLLLAVRVDELDRDRAPMTDEQLERREHEEVHLMFRANQAVRNVLPREGQERARRIRLVTEALQSQIGSESRHLRRLAIALHGLQMVGNADEEVAPMDSDDEWLPGLVDELLLLAGQEDAGVSEESWTEELVALRRWLAEDGARGSEGPDDRGDQDADENHTDDVVMVNDPRGRPE